MTDNTKSENAVIIERTFDAPIELVWQMWTDSEHFKNWYGPEGFTVPVVEMDVSVGGKRLVCMKSPDGSMTMWTSGEFTELVPHERLVYTESLSDENGTPVPQSEQNPMGTTSVTVMLESIDGGTKMTMTHAGVPADSGANHGWNQSFTKMERYLATI